MKPARLWVAELADQDCRGPLGDDGGRTGGGVDLVAQPCRRLPIKTAKVDARAGDVGARAELKAIADEVNQIVRFMDGANRFRFATDAEALAAWDSASNTFGPVRAGMKAVEPAQSAAKGKSAADHAARFTVCPYRPTACLLNRLMKPNHAEPDQPDREPRER